MNQPREGTGQGVVSFVSFPFRGRESGFFSFVLSFVFSFVFSFVRSLFSLAWGLLGLGNKGALLRQIR